MHKFIFVVSAPFFLVPLLKLILVFSRRVLFLFSSQDFITETVTHQQKNTFFSRTNRFFQKLLYEFEYYVNFFRFYFLGSFLIIYSLYQAYPLIQGQSLLNFSWPFWGMLVLIALSFWSQSQKYLADLRLAEFLREHPRIHPDDFFYLYKRELAFGLPRLFLNKSFRDILPQNADFRCKSRAQIKSNILLFCLIDTMYFTYMVMIALRKLGPDYAREVADPIANMWGKRMLSWARNSLVVEGLEKFQGKAGKFLLIFNHKSSLDFVFTFFALSEVVVGERHLRPRFIVAKDHFKDNPLIYRVLGIGRAIEVLNMVFIERKNRKKSFENLKQAAKFMVDKDIDIAIYPQGTRATGNFDRAGKRRDAGYYTTVSPKSLNKTRPHLKKGTAYLIFDTLQELHERDSSENLNLVFIGVDGTANTLPRGSLKVQTENQIRYVIGDILTLSPQVLNEILNEDQNGNEFEQARSHFVDQMHELIDQKLKEAMNLHVILKKRFLTDIKGALGYENDKIAMIAQALDEAAQYGDEVFQIIDRIYSLPTQEWNGYLSQLCQILQGKPERDRFHTVLSDVSQKLVA